MNRGDTIAGCIDTLVSADALAGAATIVWRDGRIVHRVSDRVVRGEARAHYLVASPAWRSETIMVPFIPSV